MDRQFYLYILLKSFFYKSQFNLENVENRKKGIKIAHFEEQIRCAQQDKISFCYLETNKKGGRGLQSHVTLSVT